MSRQALWAFSACACASCGRSSWTMRARSTTRSAAGHSGFESLDETATVSPARRPQFAALDEALQRLATISRRKSDVVELRFFGGLTVEETAEALGVSRLTVIRDWNFARARLLAEMSGKNPR